MLPNPWSIEKHDLDASYVRGKERRGEERRGEKESVGKMLFDLEPERQRSYLLFLQNSNLYVGLLHHGDDLNLRDAFKSDTDP